MSKKITLSVAVVFRTLTDMALWGRFDFVARLARWRFEMSVISDRRQQFPY